MPYVNTRAACSQLGVHPNTLRAWDEKGWIKTIRTPGGKRLYDISSVSQGKAKIIYARVSNNGQKPDLEQQIQYLRTRYPEYELIQDVGSGLNFKRKGLKTLLDRVLSGDVEEIVIAHRDRLCRFGFDIFAAIADKFNTRIVVLDGSSLSPQEELVQDLLSIIHVFSCRLYGLRKYSRKIKEDKDLPKVGEQTEAE
jgi:predicted site-specific integrase-resolvase